jgi:hypothetical protein
MDADGPTIEAAEVLVEAVDAHPLLRAELFATDARLAARQAARAALSRAREAVPALAALGGALAALWGLSRGYGGDP